VIDFGFGAELGAISDVPAETMRIWRNSPAIYKWCRQYEPLNSWSHEGWLDSLCDRQDVKMYGIWDREHMGASPVGVCGLTSIDLINRHAEFSVYVGPEHHGNAHGKNALKTLCAHGFLALGLVHIFGETFDGNPAARAFEAVGFVREGTRRGFYFRQGKYIDAHIYSVLAGEFRTRWSL
jgi:RimJ/RimL family protein N-acetyltransferase